MKEEKRELLKFIAFVCLLALILTVYFANRNMHQNNLELWDSQIEFDKQVVELNSELITRIEYCEIKIDEMVDEND